MRRAFAAAGLCLLLSLAGCSYIPGLSDGPAPGVEDEELADAQALLDAHQSTLSKSGYSHELSVNQTASGEEGTVEQRRRQRMAVAAESSQYLRQVIYDGQGRVIAWGNESVEYIRVDAGGTTQYQLGEPESKAAMTGVNTLEPFLSAPFEVVETEEVDGTKVLALESTGRPDDEAAYPSNTTAVESFEARLVIDEEGRIHRLRATAEYEVDGEPGGYQFAFELTATEDPGVEKPDWVDEIAE